MSATPPVPEAPAPVDAVDAALAMVAARASDSFGERGLQVEYSHGELSLVIPREDHLALAAFLRDDPELRFGRFVDLCGLDTLGLGNAKRFVSVYRLHSFLLGRWVSVRVPLAAYDVALPSLTPDWPAANWYEREAFDLFGFSYIGHPKLERLLLAEDWDEGPPLRKDHPFEPEVVEFSYNVDKINAGKIVERPRLRNRRR
jgi:NADH-quinone oxidoreductase subunit C